MSRRAPVELDVHRLVADRWSPRAFSDEPVPAEVRERLFEAARWSPSCFNEQPWRFLVASRDEDPVGHASLAALFNDSNARWAPAAPLLVLGVAMGRFAHNDKPNAHARYDLGQAIAWLSMQATHEGLHLHQVAGFHRDRAQDLGLPEAADPVVMLAIGYAGDAGDLPEVLAAKERGPRVRRPRADSMLGIPWMSSHEPS